MKNTGEQLIPGLSSDRLSEEHFLRYEFVQNYCIDKVVLDIACGTGYGAYKLSKVAKSVTGVDVSKEAVMTAVSSYKKDNLFFIQDDCTKVSFNHKFDVVVSFETVEHLDYEERQKFYSICNNFLTDDGVFIVSTPNKNICSPYTDKPLNKFHVLEFTKHRLMKDLENFFIINKFFGQRFIYTFLTWKLVRKFIRVIELLVKKDFKIYSELTSPRVKEWSSVLFTQPRIMLCMMKKRINFNPDDKK